MKKIMALLRIIIPAHTKLDGHKHPIINVGYMTKGSLTVTSDDGRKVWLTEYYC